MLLILGQGYSGGWLAGAARAQGLEVLGVTRAGGNGCLAFADSSVADAIAVARYIVSTIPPEGVRDPVLTRHGEALRASDAWIGYLSSTGVYGGTGGAWVDEGAPTGTGRRAARTAADQDWQALGATIFRLPGIYGPGRSAFDLLRAGTARRVLKPGHRFSRVHVADIAGGVLAAARIGAKGIFNVTDELPAEPREVTEFACRLSGHPLPPLATLELAALSPMARAFWTEERAVTGEKLKRETGYRLRFPDYKAGLTAIWTEERQ